MLPRRGAEGLCATTAILTLTNPRRAGVCELVTRPDGLPGVMLWGGFEGGEDGVDLLVQFRGDLDFEGAEGAVKLLDGSWADDGASDEGLGQSPGEGDVGGLFADGFAEVFPLGESVAASH